MPAKNLHACLCVTAAGVLAATSDKEKKRNTRRKRRRRKKKTPDKTVESIVVPCVGINKLEQNEHSQEKGLV